MAAIKENRNYDLFSPCSFNRSIGKTKSLEESMRKYGWIDAYPAHVVQDKNGKLRVKAWHHRCFVAKKLGLPIKYVVCDDGGASIHELERSSRGWSLADYVESYSREGKVDYGTAIQLSRDTGIGLGITITMLLGCTAGSNGYTSVVKNGEFYIKERKHFDAVADLVAHFRSCGVKPWNAHALIVAVSKLLFVKEFDAATLKRKISQYPQKLKRQPNALEYLRAIESIYNWQNREKLNLAFLASEASRLRSALPKARVLPHVRGRKRAA